MNVVLGFHVAWFLTVRDMGTNEIGHSVGRVPIV